MQVKLIFALAAITVLIVGTMTLTKIDTYAYGQQQQQQQSKTNVTFMQQNKTSTASPINETKGWLDSFILKNCNFASHGANNYFI